MYDKTCNKCLKEFDSLSTQNKVATQKSDRRNDSNLFQNSNLGSIRLSDSDENLLSDRGSINEIQIQAVKDDKSAKESNKSS